MAYPDDLPTCVDGSLGQTKVNTSAYGSKTETADASEYNAIKSSVQGVCAALGMPDGSTADSVFARLVTVEPLSAIDPASTAQFSTSQTLPAPEAVLSAGLVSPGLTSATNALAPTGKTIRIAANSSAAGGIGVWWIDTECPLDEIDSIEAFIALESVAALDAWYAGIAIMGDATEGSFVAYMLGVDAAADGYLTIVRSDSPGGALLSAVAVTTGSGLLKININGTPGDGSNPPGVILCHDFIQGMPAVHTEGLLTTADIEALTTWGATWDTATCNRVGLVLQSTTGAAAAGGATFHGLRVNRRVR